MTHLRIYNQLGLVVIESNGFKFNIESRDNGKIGNAFLRNNKGKVLKSIEYSNLIGADFNKAKAYDFLIDLAELIQLGLK